MMRSRRYVRAALSMAALGALAAACGTAASASSSSAAPAAPRAITVGTTYAASGGFSAISLPELDGLKLWISLENAKGGAYVGAYHKRIPLKLVAYNDQSNPQTAGVLYNQLVTQDKVNILVSDVGSVLTAPAVSVAQAHHVLLFDATGTGTTFFTPGNPYIVLCDMPVSSVWPDPLARFIVQRHIRTVAIVYDENDFGVSQAETLRAMLTAAGVHLVTDEAVPTSTTSYGTIISTLASQHPDAVLELGYPQNDGPFLAQLASSGAHFPMVFTVNPGLVLPLFTSQLPPSSLSWIYTYGTNFYNTYTSVTEGLATQAFVAKLRAAYPSAVNSFGLFGYNTGLVIEAALRNATSLSQRALRNALTKVSGSLRTVNGTFAINAEGAQVGEHFPLAQLFPSHQSVRLELVTPPASSLAAAVYPAP